MRVTIDRSVVGGLGVFSSQDLNKGDSVFQFEFEREVTESEPLRPERGELSEHAPWIDGRYFLVASPGRYLNHSCDPNSFLRFGHTLGEPVILVTRRDVLVGTELTIDYLINNPGGTSWPCCCGAKRCRGETGVSFFTLPEDVQLEYFSILAPWFRKRFANQLEQLERRSA